MPGPASRGDARGRDAVARWSPILAGDERAEALLVVRRLAASVSSAIDDVRDGSLAGGLAGVGLFLSFVASIDPQPVWRRPHEVLEAAFDACGAEDPAPASLYGGMAGISWAMAEHVRLGGPHFAGDPCGAVDDALAGLTRDWRWDGDYDLVKGLVGVGLYGLARVPRPAAASIVRRVVTLLGEGAEAATPGLTWRTPAAEVPPRQRGEAPDGYHNLGLAHGVPGVVSFLAQTHRSGIESERVRRLLDGAVEWLLGQRLEGSASSFPYWVAPRTSPAPARLAWCYGDAGVAAALLLAAGSTGRADWRDEAEALTRRAAARADDCGVTDTSLCHGAAGLGHLFNRFHQAVGLPELAHASLRWLRLAMTEAVAGKAGPGEAPHVRAGAPGFLEGASGLGLAMLGAATDVEPTWDALLGVSPAQRWS